MPEPLTLTPEDAALLEYALESAGPARLAVMGRDNDADRLNDLMRRIRSHARLVPAPLNGDLVWHGLTMRLVDSGTVQGQSSTIVRASSAAAAMRMLAAAGERGSAGRFRNYWSVTGNPEELALATEPGIWAKGREGWVKVVPKPTLGVS